jgi:hypothetical protein
VGRKIKNSTSKSESSISVNTHVNDDVCCGCAYLQVTMLGFHAGSEVIGVLLGVAGAAIGIIAQQLTAHL